MLVKGPPSEPEITFNANILCISTYSHEEFPVDNFTIQLTDATGIPINQTGTYDTSSPLCLSIASDPIPDLCLPFQASVSVTNAVGTNSSTQLFTEGQRKSL